MSAAEASVNSLPEDLILEVFLRLPRKSLVRSKCVSKGMLNLVDRPSFKKRYHTFHNFVSDFAVMCNKPSLRLQLSMDFHLPDNLHSPIEKEVNIPLNGNYPFFLGCCKGIVCLMVTPNEFFLADRNSESYILFNPFNGTFQKVEGCKLEPLNSEFTLGFGYDYATDDYKIAGFQPSDVPCVFVYSLRRDSWRKVVVEFNPGYSKYGVDGICVDGVIHWLWSDNPRHCTCITAFDLETESVRSFSLPEEVRLNELRHLILKDFGGRLCICVKNLNGSTSVWVMEEYGVESSWSPLFTFVDMMIQPFGYFPTWDDAQLLCFRSRSDLRSFLWLNTQDGSKKDIQIHKLPHRQKGIRYELTESCVCVRSPVRLRCSGLKND